MVGNLDDPEVELGLDPDLGEGGEEERILGGRGKAEAADEDQEGMGGKLNLGVGANPGTFKELHRRLLELKSPEADEGAGDSKQKVWIV